MTSSNVSNLLVQVSQVDVSVTSDKASMQVNAGLFEKTLKDVANRVPSADVAAISKAPDKKPDRQTTKLDTSTKGNRSIKQEQENKPVEENSEFVEKVETVVEEVKEAIKDQLDVTEEDIEQAMENLGLTFIDLLNPQNLAQVVSELTGETESITLVLSDDFAGILDKVTELTDQLFKETNNFSFTDLKELVSQVETTLVQETEEVITPTEPEIPENLEPELVVNTDEDISEEKQPVVQVVSEEVKPVEKKEEAVTEEAKTAIKPEEEINAGEPKAKQEDNSSFDGQKKEELPQENIKVPEKTHNEAVIKQGEGILPPQQSIQPQFVPEESVVTLPTGETVRPEEIVNQLVEQAKVMTDSESTTMEMTLNPEGLGKIYLEVTQKGEEITAKIFTENDAVKQALETQMAALRTEMNQTSSKVTSIEVSVGTHEFERNLDENGGLNSQNQEQSSEHSARRRSRINLNNLDELTGMMSEEELLVAQMMKDNGGTLDFMA